MSKKRKSIRAKLIANPGSGAVTRDKDSIAQAIRALEDQGLEVDVALVHPKGRAVGAARKAAKQGYDIVVAMGGDDSIEAVIRGLAGSKTRLGIIPAGTANNIADTLGIPCEPVAACELIGSGQTRWLDLAQLTIKKHKKFVVFEVVTVGLSAALYPDVKEASKGRLSTIKDAVATLVTHPARPQVDLTLDDDSKVRVETMLVTITNMPIIGAHFLVAPDASMSDGLFDVAVYPDLDKAGLMAYFAKVMNEGETQDGKIQRYRARKIKVKTSPKLEVMADGVMLGKGTVRIKVRRRALRVFAPKAGAGVERSPEQAGADLPAPVSPAATT